MKQFFTVALIIISLAPACNNKSKKAAPKGSSPAATLIQETVTKARQKTEELQQLTAYTNAEIQSVLPAELAGDSAINLSAYSNMGTAFAKAEYRLTDSTSLELSVFDCGGNAGAGIYNTQYINQLGNTYATGTEYCKIIELNGEKAIEYANKKNNISSLTWLANGRLLVMAEGKNISADEVRQIAVNLSLN